MNKDLSNITSLLSVAGVWTPINASDPTTHNGIPPANVFYSQITLPDGNKGLVLNGWAYDGWNNTTHYDLSASILEENANGTMGIATSKWLPDAINHGSGSVIVADLNGDGKQDIFLAAHNESPFLPNASTAYVSNASGGFTKASLTDYIAAHGATEAILNGVPTVFTATYAGDGNPYYQYVNGAFVETQLLTSYVAPDGTRYQTTGGDSVAVADFNGDAHVDIVIGDNGYGPGNNYQPSNPPLIAVYKFSDVVNNTGTAEADLAPYFNSRSQYANVQSLNGLGLTHTYRVWVDDFNHDGKPDILAGGSMWSSTDNSQNLSMLQMLQNTSANGATSFVDKTDTLNKDYNVKTAEVDYSMQMVDIDHSGINTYFIAGSLSAYSNAVQDNYILLNDGTGQMHVYMHDQFQTIGDQVNAYLGMLGVQSSSQSRLIEYQTPNGNINLEAELGTATGVYGNTVNQQTFINVPLQLNPTTDYTDNIIITDRNNSMVMRTWAGNDTFYDTDANAQPTRIDGGLGVNTSVYSGKVADYGITHNTDGTILVNSLSTAPVGLNDTLTNIQRIQFSDSKVSLDMGMTQSGGEAALLIGAVVGKVSLTDKALVGELIQFFDAGATMHDAANVLVNAGIMDRLAGGSSTSAYVNLIYQAVTGQVATPDVTASLAPYIDTGGYTKADFLAVIADLALNQTNVGLVGLAQTGIAYL